MRCRVWANFSNNVLVNLENVLAIKSKILVTQDNTFFWLEFSGRGEYVGECVFFENEEERDQEFYRLRSFLTQSKQQVKSIT